MSLLSWLPGYHTPLRWWQASQYPDTRAHDGIIAAQAIMWWPVPTAQAITGGCSHSNQLWTAANMIMITRGGRQYNWQLLHPRWWPDFFVFTPWDSKLAKTNPNYSHPFVPWPAACRCPISRSAQAQAAPGTSAVDPARPASPELANSIFNLIQRAGSQVSQVLICYELRLTGQRKPDISEFRESPHFLQYDSWPWEWCQESGPFSFFVPVTKIFGDWFYIDTRHQCVVICCQDTIWNVPVWLHSRDARIVVNAELRLVAQSKCWPPIGLGHWSPPWGRACDNAPDKKCQHPARGDRPGYFEHEACCQQILILWTSCRVIVIQLRLLKSSILRV